MKPPRLMDSHSNRRFATHNRSLPQRSARAHNAASMPSDDLPLRYLTPARWAAEVLERPLELLNDHAHLEKKAATNALELVNRYPEPTPPENWVSAMTAIARDEVEHLAVVCRL